MELFPDIIAMQFFLVSICGDLLEITLNSGHELTSGLFEAD
jgi:hypothetical protein